MPQGQITFRNSKIVYYGPHPCENCGKTIAKMGYDWGGTAFTYPEGPIYPNTEWHPHVCDPEHRYSFRAKMMKDYVLAIYPQAEVVDQPGLGFAIWNMGRTLHPASYGATEDAAWHCAACSLDMPLALEKP